VFVARGLLLACCLVSFFCELVSFLVVGFYVGLLTFFLLDKCLFLLLVNTPMDGSWSFCVDWAFSHDDLNWTSASWVVDSKILFFLSLLFFS